MGVIRIQCAYRSKVARSKTNMRQQQFQGSDENQKNELQKSEDRHMNSAGSQKGLGTFDKEADDLYPSNGSTSTRSICLKVRCHKGFGLKKATNPYLKLQVKRHQRTKNYGMLKEDKPGSPLGEEVKSRPDMNGKKEPNWGCQELSLPFHLLEKEMDDAKSMEEIYLSIDCYDFEVEEKKKDRFIGVGKLALSSFLKLRDKKGFTIEDVPLFYKIEKKPIEKMGYVSIEIWIDANGEEDQPTEDRLIAQRPTKEDPTWYTCQDSEGNTYYYNSNTEECSWFLPPELDGISATCPPDLLSSVQKIFEGKAKMLGKDTQLALERAKRAQKVAEAKRDAGIAAGEDHWVECFDPATDRFYYYGNYSGEVLWEKPGNYVMAADDELMTAVVRIQSAFRARMARLSTKDLAALKNVVWYMMDDGEGNTYYYNSTTGECWLVFSPIAPPIINKSVIGECWFV